MRAQHMADHYVFVHGSPGTRHSWDPLLAAAPADWRCHAWDLLDHGDSDAPQASVDDMVAEVVRRTAALEGRVTLVGHSFGAWVVGRALASLEGKIDHVVILGGLGSIPGDLAARSTQFAEALESGQLTLSVAADMGADIWLPVANRRADDVRRVHEEIERAPVARICRVLRRHADLAAPERRVLGGATRATFLHAVDDRGCPISSGRALAAVFPHSVFHEIEGDSHFLHWTHVERVLDALAR